MAAQLTARQREVLDYLRACLRHNGRPPTRREAAAHFGWRANAAMRCHLQALERKGAIQWDRGAARGIRLVDGETESEVRIPVLSDVPAGKPSEATADNDEMIPLSRSAFPHPEELFALRVRGDSMIGAGILDGDRLIVRKAQEAAPGQIVVVRIDGAATVKRLVREGRRLFLHPENPAHRDIAFTPGQEAVIEGIGLGVFRLF